MHVHFGAKNNHQFLPFKNNHFLCVAYMFTYLLTDEPTCLLFMRRRAKVKRSALCSAQNDDAMTNV